MTIKRATEVLRAFMNQRTKGQYCSCNEKEIDDAMSVAIDLLECSAVKSDIESIVAAVSRMTGVARDEIINKGRQHEFAEARAMVCWLAYHYSAMTVTSIGKWLGRNHVSVIHYNRMVDEWLNEPRLNLRGSRIVTKLIRELEDDD
jgi:chromosomal replication initiation ATPase DnaA